MTDSNIVEAHLPCPIEGCGSSDAYAVYDDGHGWCHSCNGYVTGNNTDYATGNNKENNMTLTKLPYQALPDRNISLATCKFYGVMSDEAQHIYPYADQSGTWKANKIRTLPKQFFSEGEKNDLQLFGQPKFSGGGKYVTITEGELDALSGYELLGSKFPVVSVRSSSTALKDCKANFEWLDSFKNIVIAFDADKPGQEAALAVAELFGFKSKIMKMDKAKKDPNNYLKAGEFKLFSTHWWAAEGYSPDGIVAGKDLWDVVSKPMNIVSVPYPWDELNKITYGMRFGEMITLTAGSGMGKTQVLRELEHHIIITTEYNIGAMFLEETVRDSGLGLMSIDASVPFHLPDSEYDDDALKSAYDNTLGKDRVFYYESFGSNSIANILNRIKFFAKAKDCKFIFLDHISILVSDQSFGDERKALDEIATKLKTLCLELDICLVMVSHAKRQTSKSHEEGGQTSLSDLRGTAGIGHLSNIVLGLERDGQAKDMDVRNTTLVRVLKNRFSGLTGPSSMLKYSKDTGRLAEISWNEMEEEEDA